MANDLLGRSNPFQSGKAEESLLDAVKRASPGIDRQFANEPQVELLHRAIAHALDMRTDYADARGEYEQAAAWFVKSEGPLSEDAMIVELQRAAMEPQLSGRLAGVCQKNPCGTGVKTCETFRAPPRFAGLALLSARHGCVDR